MRQTILGVVIGGALAASAAVQIISAQPAPTRQLGPDIVGRFQVVNGTPELAINIMLLDTVTGDTWVKCSSEETSVIWCAIPKSNNATAPKKPPQ